MTDAELQVLRDAAIGPERGPRAGEHVAIVSTGGAVAREPAPEWGRVPLDDTPFIALGYVDNLDEHGGTVMVYGREETWALRFWEIEQVGWRDPAHA